MGSAFTGVADDASALFSNPAGLGFLGQGELFLNSDLWLVGTFQETALAGIPAGGAGGFGLAAQYLDYGSMEGRDSLGSLTANYGANRLGFQAGWGYEILRHLSVGVGLSALQTTLAGTGYTSFSSNFGVLWKGPAGFRLGASYVNAAWISPGGSSEEAVNLGASYAWVLDRTNRLLVAAGGTLEPGAVNYAQAGAEYSFQGLAFLRVGCQVPLSDQSVGGLADLTAGVGFRLSGFSLDYAFLPYGDLGAAHRVSLGYFFDDGKKQSSAAPRLPASQRNNLAGPVGKSSGLTGYTIPGATTGNMATNSLPSLPGLPSLPPANNTPAALQAPGAVTVSGPAASQPRAVSPAEAKDSLVVQFDLPDGSSPTTTGADLEKEGKTKEAMAAYIAALKQNPNDAASWWALGNLYREQHQKTYAVQCFEQVLKLQPQNHPLADWLSKYRMSNP